MPTKSKPYDYISAVIDFEQGTLEDKDVLILFQYLINTRLINQLQGFYGRTARDLINAGRLLIIDGDCHIANVVDGSVVKETPQLSNKKGAIS